MLRMGDSCVGACRCCRSRFVVLLSVATHLQQVCAAAGGAVGSHLVRAARCVVHLCSFRVSLTVGCRHLSFSSSRVFPAARLTCKYLTRISFEWARVVRQGSATQGVRPVTTLRNVSPICSQVRNAADTFATHALLTLGCLCGPCSPLDGSSAAARGTAQCRPCRHLGGNR